MPFLLLGEDRGDREEEKMSPLKEPARVTQTKKGIR